jgi:hypothetical protein
MNNAPKMSSMARPIEAETEFARLLQEAPRPLLAPNQRLLVIFSAKSACTSVLIWFLHQIGHADVAYDYSRWPHHYRMGVYYKSRLYRMALKKRPSRYSVVRVVRDPFERAVSSFRHMLASGAGTDLAGKALRRNDIETAGLSFSEYLDFLDTCDLRTSDQHYALQRHPIEDVVPVDHLINISTENLFARLNDVEADLGLPITDFAQLSWLKHLDQARSPNRPGPVIDAYSRRFDREAARNEWPKSSAFLVPEARDRIARLYATDIQSYGATAPATLQRRLEPALASS